MLFTIVWILSIFFIVKAVAKSSKPDYVVNWEPMPKHTGVIKLKSIVLPDEMFDYENDWHTHIRDTLTNHKN